MPRTKNTTSVPPPSSNKQLFPSKKVQRSSSSSRTSKKSYSDVLKPNYPKRKYVKILRKPDDPFGPQTLFEVDGIPLCKRSESKGIGYFECLSHRHRNDPSCNFRGRIRNFLLTALHGEIEIIVDHSDTCKYIPGNKAKDFEKNTKILANFLIYKSMKTEIEMKLETENWLTPGEY